MALTRTKCTGPTCGDDIVFIRARRKDGSLSPKPWPLNPDPLPGMPDTLRGVFVFEDDEIVRSATPRDDGPFFTAHHGTCPDADQFRG